MCEFCDRASSVQMHFLVESMPDGDFSFKKFKDLKNYQDHLPKFGIKQGLSSKRAS